MPTESSPPVLPRNFMRPCLLLLLREQAAHGYELLERLEAFGYDRSDPGGLYRALRSLEQEGVVHSAWEQSGSGPDRRIYEITRRGMESLHEQAQVLAGTSMVIGAFLSRYEEFASVSARARERSPARATRA